MLDLVVLSPILSEHLAGAVYPKLASMTVAEGARQEPPVETGSLL